MDALHAEKLAVLSETAEALMAELELPQLLEIILGKVRNLFQVDRCALLELDRRSNRLRILRSVGYDAGVAAGFSVPVGQGISGWVASSGLPAFVEDLSADQRYIPGVSGAVSEVAVPLRHREQVVGVLDIESTVPLRKMRFDMALLTLFANQCATALHNASLVRQLEERQRLLEHRVRELQVLNHVGKLLGEVLSLDEVLAEILRLAKDVLQFKACAVLLPEEEGGDCLRIRAAVGYPSSVVEKARVRKGEGVTGAVFRSGIPRLVEDVTRFPGYIPGTDRGQCEMACPLISRGKVLGVLDAEGEQPGAFTEQQFVLFATFASQAAVAIRNAQVVERKQTVYYQTISTLANALEARDSYTRGHSERVTMLAAAIGAGMGLGEHELGIIRQAGLLHDLGKIGVPDGVLNKPAGLSEEERDEIEHHPRFGNDIIGQLAFLADASKAILHHHERYDGSGYPSGLLGAEIPMVARIIAVADSWDAMTTARPYRQPMGWEAARRELEANAGKQFDPDVVRVFLSVLDQREETR